MSFCKIRNFLIRETETVFWPIPNVTLGGPHRYMLYNIYIYDKGCIKKCDKRVNDNNLHSFQNFLKTFYGRIIWKVSYELKYFLSSLKKSWLYWKNIISKPACQH